MHPRSFRVAAPVVEVARQIVIAVLAQAEFVLLGLLAHATDRPVSAVEVFEAHAHFTDQDAEEEKRKCSPADNVQIDLPKGKRRGFRNG
jgi:hypothetical protein